MPSPDDLLPCGHPTSALEEHEPYLGTTRLWYCSKCLRGKAGRFREDDPVVLADDDLAYWRATTGETE